MSVNKRVMGVLLALVLVGAGVAFWPKGEPTKPSPASAVVESKPGMTIASAPVEAEDEEEDEDAAEAAAQKLALFFGQDDRVFVPPPYEAPFAAIGKLQTEGESHCTATLVAPDLAVTAAHCFFMTPRKLDKGVWFWAGYHDGKWLARYKIEGVSYHARFRQGLVYKGDDVYIKPKVAAYDIALMKLKLVDGVPPKPMPLFSGNADQLLNKIHTADSQVTQAGFAYDHKQKLTAHIGCSVTSLVADNTLEHQCDTLSGDSGSPLWLWTEQGPQLVAVQSAAPDWFNRDKADNTAVTVLQLPKRPK